MATGRLGTIAGGLNGATMSNPYFVPNGTYSVFNISVTNTSATAVTVAIALSTATTSSGINSGDYIEYGTTVVGKGVLERTGLVAGAGIYVYVGLISGSSTQNTAGSNVTVNVYGIETSTS
jgi:hypothetical protein